MRIRPEADLRLPVASMSGPTLPSPKAGMLTYMLSKSPERARKVSCQIPTAPSVPIALLNCCHAGRCRAFLILCVAHQTLHTFPVLNEDDGSREPHFMTQQAKFWRPVEFGQHLRHRCSDGQPLSNLKWAIDAHTDKEDHDVSLGSCRHSGAMEHGGYDA